MKKKSKKSKKKTFKLKRTKKQLLYDQLSELTPTIASVLMKDKISRDDDNKLAIEVWKKQGMKLTDSFKKFAYNLILNKITTPESIGRTRREIQCTHPEFQGPLYKIRRENEKKYIRNQLSLF